MAVVCIAIIIIYSGAALFVPLPIITAQKRLLWYVQMKPRRVHMLQTNARSQTIAVQTLCFFSLDWTSKSWHS